MRRIRQKAGLNSTQHEPRRSDAGLDQSFGDRPGPRSELDHRPVAVRIDIARHGARKHFARRRHRADGQRPLDPGADEAHLVIEPNAALALELPDLVFDLLADIVALLLEQPDVASDVALDNGLLQLEKPQLPLDLSVQMCAGPEATWQHHTRRNRRLSRTFNAGEGQPRPARLTLTRNWRGRRRGRRGTL